MKLEPLEGKENGKEEEMRKGFDSSETLGSFMHSSHPFLPCDRLDPDSIPSSSLHSLHRPHSA